MNSDWLIVGRRTIQKESEALAELAKTLEDSFVTAVERIRDCQGTVLLTGMGKSGLVARKWSSTFSSTGTKSYFINPAEAPHGDLGIVHPNDILIALSNSGETEELGVILRHARETGISTIGVTSNPASSLSRQVELLLPIRVKGEACPLNLAPTTSTTLMMAMGDALAIVLMQMKGWTEKNFARLHPGGSLGRRLWLRVDELMHRSEALPLVGATDSLDRVLIEMTEKRLGLAIVREGDQVLGLITDGDLRRHLQKRKVDREAVASDLMTTKPKTVTIDALAVEARELMEKNKIQHVLVMDEGALVGVVHLQDLLRAKVV
ncbi:MAG: KpsF/GutQ family sugar-phosphate isomerase [Deltaproteobacteria bacterium]|nr:KpsF/GutQ family sugar-phosphate isomerase [Deltaproteobacteria bacterium]MBI3294795.1 KpsF/GutQ family sugar-phosphate isomerase [Deltaproteobacteria bacterium]